MSYFLVQNLGRNERQLFILKRKVPGGLIAKIWYADLFQFFITPEGNSGNAILYTNEVGAGIKYALCCCARKKMPD